MKTHNQNHQLSSLPLFVQIPALPAKSEKTSAPLLLNNFGYREYLTTHQTIKNIAFFNTETFYLIYCRSGKLIFRHNGHTKYIRSHQSCMFFDANGQGFLLESNDPAARYFVIALNKPERNFFNQNSCCFAKLKKEGISLSAIF